MNIRALLVTTAAIGSLAACGAHAQVALPPAAPSAASDATTLATVVVTAERRAVDLQKSAVPINVLSATDIDRASITTASSLSTVVPGLQIGGNGAYTQIFIRGIGDRSNTFLSNASVATYLDGVPLLRATEVNGNFFDLQRVEVLKGPQGTLYGRNATGGAINLNSARPTQAYGGYAEGEVGSYNLFKFEGALNAPISEQFAARAAMQIVSRDGYLSDGTNDDKQQNVRLSGLWTPNDQVSLLLTAGLSHQGGKGGGLALTYPQCSGGGCASPWTGITSPIANTIRLNRNLPSSGALVSYPAAGYPPQLDNTNIYVTGELNWKLGFATLTVLPSFHSDRYVATTYPGLVFYNNVLAQQGGTEVRLAADGTKLKWVVGAFYVHENQTGVNTAIQNVDGSGASSVTKAYGPGLVIDSKAVFGQATYSVTSKFRLTGGLRYTDELSSMTENQYGCSVAVCPGALLFNINGASVGTRKVTGKAGAEYDLTPRNFLYATYSTGFKAAGLFTAPPPNAYKPEEIEAYEIGSRNRFADGKIQFNLEAYRWQYHNQVYNYVGPAPTSGYVTLVFVNVGSGYVQGASADLGIKPWNGGTIRFAVDYADSDYTNFTYDSLTGQKGLANTTCSVGATHTNAQHIPVQTIDCTGRPFILAPKWSGTAAYEHALYFGNGGILRLTATADFTTSRYSQVDFLPSEQLPNTALFDLDAQYSPGPTTWSLGVYVHNIGNTPNYSQSQNLSGTAGASAPAGGPVIAGTIGAPRTVGAKLKYTF